MVEGWRMWAISLLTILLLLPLLSAAPLDIAGGVKKVDVKTDNDGMHSHDENVTRGGKLFGHNQFLIGNHMSVDVEGDDASIGHNIDIDVHVHSHDHHHDEADSVIECKEGLRELFKSIDSNKNGLVDAKELLRVCHQNNLHITESLAVRILTLPDKTVGFNLAKFCELLKDCPSTNSADLIYFLLQLFDKVSGPLLSEDLPLGWTRSLPSSPLGSASTNNEGCEVHVGKSTSNTISATVSECCVCPTVVNKGNWIGDDTYSDEFWVMQDGSTLQVQRTDSDNGWTMDLSFKCNQGCEVHVGKSTSNTISATVSECCVCPTVVNKGNWIGDDAYSDEFRVTQDGSSLQVQRTDSDNGWTMDLSFKCNQGFEVHVGKSTSNTISATVSECCVCPTVVNKGNWIGDYTYSDEFRVTQDGSSLQVQRTDSDNGWTMDLSFKCNQDCPTDETLTNECMCGGKICASGGRCASGSKCIPDRLHKGQKLLEEEILRSQNEEYDLVMQSDGNLVIYENFNKQPKWSSASRGAGSHMIFQLDGNLVVYPEIGKKTWSTDIYSESASSLVMQNDGNLVLYAANNVLWASHTGVPEIEFICPSGDKFTSKLVLVDKRLKQSCLACWERADGCSSPWFKEEVQDYFRTSCDIHDLCYGYRGRSKDDCDNDFKHNMLKQCEGKDWSKKLYCKTMAETVYQGVSVDLIGDGEESDPAEFGYNSGQEAAKTCILR